MVSVLSMVLSLFLFLVLRSVLSAANEERKKKKRPPTDEFVRAACLQRELKLFH